MARPVLEISPGFFDIRLYVPRGGVSWQPIFTCTNYDADGNPSGLYDFTGASAVMLVKDASTGALLDELSTTTGGGNGRLVLGGAAGTLKMIYPKAVTNEYAFGSQPFDSAVYDLSVTDASGNEVPFFAGNMIVVPGV